MTQMADTRPDSYDAVFAPVWTMPVAMTWHVNKTEEPQQLHRASGAHSRSDIGHVVRMNVESCVLRQQCGKIWH